MSLDYLDQLSQFVVDTRLEDLDGSTVTAAKAVVLDTIGAILAGSRLPENANLARLAQGMSSAGPATLFGHPGKVQPPFAALVNATAGVSLEMDEGNRLGGGHPSVHVTPGAIGVAEEQRAGGRALLESVIVGYEVTSRIGTGTKTRAAIHSHGTWGTIGAAAATARLMGFDAAQTRQALNLAMSMSPANTWTPCLEGATIRNLYPGRSGFQGIMAAHLVGCGFTAVQDGPADLYRDVLGEGFDPAAVVDGLGRRGACRIQQNYFKFHACCFYNHPALDAVQALLRREEFAASDVEHIRVTAPPMALTMANPEPENMLSAKFSIPYAVAAALVHGSTGVTTFYPEKLADAQTRSLAQRVEVVADPEMNLRNYDHPASTVTVTLRDGRTLRESVTAHHGDARNPASRDELVGKFTFLAQNALGEEKVRQVIAVVDRLDDIEDIGELTRFLG
ncbi:MAG: MmgE/PrpD family protein [Dehalococcoidia bacterium]|jgi:2-methylcitrate dehydratase PrpD|nr:MmgE/PrpD family protein [Dehalococcoidia bacterium]MDP7083916.1 MmgE/PrpD family protein [Dehalococcoidia bacterium]MDP7201619.1 MmgE/PrpD family protein [Dehalococcoidia bacterium]